MQIRAICPLIVRDKKKDSIVWNMAADGACLGLGRGF